MFKNLFLPNSVQHRVLLVMIYRCALVQIKIPYMSYLPNYVPKTVSHPRAASYIMIFCGGIHYYMFLSHRYFGDVNVATKLARTRLF